MPAHLDTQVGVAAEHVGEDIQRRRRGGQQRRLRELEVDCRGAEETGLQDRPLDRLHRHRARDWTRDREADHRRRHDGTRLRDARGFRQRWRGRLAGCNEHRRRLGRGREGRRAEVEAGEAPVDRIQQVALQQEQVQSAHALRHRRRARLGRRRQAEGFARRLHVRRRSGLHDGRRGGDRSGYASARGGSERRADGARAVVQHAGPVGQRHRHRRPRPAHGRHGIRPHGHRVRRLRRGGQGQEHGGGEEQGTEQRHRMKESGPVRA